MNSVQPAQLPAEWPPFPETMSVSVLNELESCPRRWALAAASYPDVWSGRGYPPALVIPRMAGTIVHAVLEVIVAAMVRNGCGSVQGPDAVGVMRELGGYTKLIGRAIEDVLQPHSVNPRAAHRRADATRTLQNQIGKLRARVQSLLSNVNLPPRASADPAGDRPSRGRFRRPLPVGVSPEVELIASSIGWKGKADLITLIDDLCEILDFKTGQEHDAHRLQLQVYSLLWFLDEQLNPTQRLATRLTLSYADREVSVPALSSAELRILEQALSERVALARQASSEQPPLARPALENCGNCDVRHLCDAYWTISTQALLRADVAAGGSIVDAELTISRRIGAGIWEARVRVWTGPAPADRIFLRSPDPTLDLRPGDVIRVVGGRTWQPVDDPAAPSINVSSTSEVYLLSR